MFEMVFRFSILYLAIIEACVNYGFEDVPRKFTLAVTSILLGQRYINLINRSKASVSLGLM